MVFVFFHCKKIIVELDNQIVSVSHGVSGKYLLDLEKRSSSLHSSLIKRSFGSDGFEAYKNVAT